MHILSPCIYSTAASFIQRMILSSTYGPAFHLITREYL